MSKDFPSSSLRITQLELWVRMRFLFFFFRKEEKKKNDSNHSLIDDFVDLFATTIHKFESFFFEPYEEKTSYTFLGGVVHLCLSQWVIYRIVAIDVRSRREGRDLRKVGFYDPIKNQTYSNVSAILYFLEKGAQPTGTVHDISKKAEVFKEFRINQMKLMK